MVINDQYSGRHTRTPDSDLRLNLNMKQYRKLPKSCGHSDIRIVPNLNFFGALGHVLTVPMLAHFLNEYCAEWLTLRISAGRSRRYAPVGVKSFALTLGSSTITGRLDRPGTVRNHSPRGGQSLLLA